MLIHQPSSFPSVPVSSSVRQIWLGDYFGALFPGVHSLSLLGLVCLSTLAASMAWSGRPRQNTGEPGFFLRGFLGGGVFGSDGCCEGKVLYSRKSIVIFSTKKEKQFLP